MFHTMCVHIYLIKIDTQVTMITLGSPFVQFMMTMHHALFQLYCMLFMLSQHFMVEQTVKMAIIIVIFHVYLKKVFCVRYIKIYRF